MALCDLSLNLDLNNNMNVFVNCKQFDTLNINFNIFKSGLAEDLKDYKARLKAFKSDQTTLVQEHTGVTISNNVVTVKASEQLTNVSGNTIIELQFYNKITGEKKSTYNIILTVYESSINVDGSISKSTYTLLEELEYKLDQATDYFENIEKVTNLNNDIKLNITQATTLNATLKDNTDKGTTIDNSLKENIPKATEGNTTLLATIETSKTTKTGLDESIKKANDFITANGNISDLANRVDQNTKDIATLSNPNLLINGDFQVWQRGTSFENINGYTADRWKVFCGNCSTNISKVQMDTPEGKKNCIKINLSQCNNASFILRQYLEDIPLGTPLTLSYWVKGVKGSEVATTFYDANRKSEILTGEWQKITNNYTFPNDSSFKPTPFLCFLRNDGNGKLLDGDYYIANMKLEIGNKATPLTPRPYGEELVLCQRYYESGNSGGLYKGVTTGQFFEAYCTTKKRVVPTVKFDSVFVSGDNTTSSTTLKNISDNYFNYMINASVGVEGQNYVVSTKWNADAEIY